MAPRVIIILVNYNGYSDTVECIQSIKEIDYNNYQIVVVDNASTIRPTEEQIEYIKANAYVINSKENLGFSGGNNIAINYAKEVGFDYVLLLNNDTIVTKGFLKELIYQSEKNPESGVLGAKIYYESRRDKLWYGGGAYNLVNGTAMHEVTDVNDATETKEMSFITGCLMLIKKEVIEQVGLLDEDYFLYAEDTDYCCRVRQSVFSMLYCKNAVIYHKVSASTGEHSPISQYYEKRNNLYLIKKYGTKKLFAYIYNICRDIRNILFRGANIKSVFIGYYDFIMGKVGKKENFK